MENDIAISRKELIDILFVFEEAEGFQETDAFQKLDEFTWPREHGGEG